MDSLLRKTFRVRNRLKKGTKTRRESDWVIFRRIRNKVNNMKKHAIANYYDNIDSHLKDASLNNQKLYWKLLKDCFHTKLTHDIPIIRYTMDNDKEAYAFSDTDKIELLNNYFTSITFLDDSNHDLPTIGGCRFDNFCSEIKIQEHEITDIISIISVNKAVGPDCISHKMLKSCKDTISKPLCLLSNKSLSLKFFPECWKLAHVLPLFKKDDPSITSTYRPVSLLSCISKIFERIIFKHVYNHLHSQNLFYKYQAGFLPGHSTTYLLLEIYHSNVKSIDEGKFCCMVFCDLSKAFDRVWHKGLIYKLNMYGIIYIKQQNTISYV